MASGRVGASGIAVIQASKAASWSGGRRTVTGVALTAGRPLDFLTLSIDDIH